MTFAAGVREEVAHQPVDRPCCRTALLAAAFRGAGSLHLTGKGHVHGELDVGGHAVGRQLLVALRAAGATCEVRAYRPDRLGSGQRVVVVLAEDPVTQAVLAATGVVDAEGRPRMAQAGDLPGRACCRVSALRGAFAVGGTVSSPGRAPLLEVRTHERAYAEVLAACAAELGIALRVRERPRWSEAMTRRRDAVQDLLTVLGAEGSALAIAEDDVVRSARADANRRANFDTANLTRQVAAARRQLQAVERLSAEDRLATLSRELREAAALRADNPDLTLAELADVGRIARPTLAARLRRLVQEAGEPT